MLVTICLKANISFGADTSAKFLKVLQQVFYIRYSIQFQSQEGPVNMIKVLTNSNSKVNAMTLSYIAKLGIVSWKISVKAQKIDGRTLKTYSMILASFFSKII